MSNIDTNEFSFSGRIGRTPTQKMNGDLMIVESLIEQETTYRDKVTVANLPVVAFHDIGKKLLKLKLGDYVVVWGAIRSKAYTDKNGETKHFLNPTLNRIFLIKDSVENVIPPAAPKQNTAIEEDIPF
jgi:single-stranded DNA-binding protein